MRKASMYQRWSLTFLYKILIILLKSLSFFYSFSTLKFRANSMGHGKIRTDKTCLNCNHVVENKYCPNCGQENTETRQSFHYLFTHFVEDLTHYDGSFWKTIKALLFKPGRLTLEYLAGKRKLYVPPVKLYIFISFVAFLLPNILPKFSFVEDVDSNKKTESTKDEIEIDDQEVVVFNGPGITSLKQLDSIQNSLPETEKLTWAEYETYKFTIKNKEKATKAESREQIKENLKHNLPKVLFLYMPLFAFFLWLFHNKKKWYYFDSGVFTLHYFGFLLLLFTISVVLEWLFALVYSGDLISVLIGITTTTYAFFYFFRAHSTFFGEKKYISRLKSLILFIINIFLITFSFIALLAYSVYTVH